VTVGFIGFGEAGSTIAAGLAEAGVDRIVAFDIAADDSEFGPTIEQRAARAGTILVDSPAALARASEVLFSTVTSSSALEAATAIAPFLESRHLYADLNSVSPACKHTIDRVVRDAGGCFVEVAVMAPVLPYGHRVPMLVGGPNAALFAERMARFGMRCEVLSAAVGTAAAVKMCRSIVVKGLEALMCECMLGASRYEAGPHVFASLNESFPGIDWQKLADYMIGRVVVHGERRAREMEEVADTLRAIGVEPIMAEATARRQDWSAELKLRSHFGPEGPRTAAEVAAVVARLTGLPAKPKLRGMSGSDGWPESSTA
jgi:3-hydroxyisobutyrate dehydrogenase-like beta-hydroxyacid dehydrogenase